MDDIEDHRPVIAVDWAPTETMIDLCGDDVNVPSLFENFAQPTATRWMAGEGKKRRLNDMKKTNDVAQFQLGKMQENLRAMRKASEENSLPTFPKMELRHLTGVQQRMR